MLGNYIDSIETRLRFSGLLKDFFPENKMQVNLILSAYDLGILQEIKKIQFIDNAFAYRFIKMLMNDYGISESNAKWCIHTWCVCYGKYALSKQCEIEMEWENTVSEIKKQAENIHMFSYEENDSGGLTILGYNGNNQNLVIPDFYDNKPITEIGTWAFKGCTSLTSIAIPKSVTKIGYEAFAYCKSLTSVIISEGVTEIGEGTFENCKSLASVKVPYALIESYKDFANHIGIDNKILKCYYPGEYDIRHNNSKLDKNREELVSNTDDDLVIICESGSYAEKYAQENEIKHQLI